MAEFVRFTLDDGSEVLFESAESDLVALHGGSPGDQDLVVSGGWDNTVRIWDADSGERLGPPIPGRISWVHAIAMGRIGDRDVVVMDFGSSVQIYDVASKDYEYLRAGNGNSMLAVAIGRLGGRDVIVSASADKTARMWDAATGRQIGDPLAGHTSSVQALALGRVGGRDIIASASDDRTIRIWGPDQEIVTVIDLLERASAIAISSRGVLYVATGVAIVSFA